MIAPVRARCEVLEMASRSVKGAIKGLNADQLAYVPPGFANSIATLVVHMAATEVNLAMALGAREVPAEVKSALLLDRYTPVPGSPIAAAEGETTESLAAKLDQARSILLETLGGLTEEDVEREISFGPGRTTTVGFVLNLLPFHMASHYGQIQLIKRFLGGPA